MRSVGVAYFVVSEFVLPLAAVGAFIATILLWAGVGSGQG